MGRVGVQFGSETETGLPVTLSDEARRLGIYIIGLSGMGKSTLLLQLILQDLDAGHGLCVLDPHGDLIEDVLARRKAPLEHVILLDPTDWRHPFGLNVFDCHDPTDPIARAVATDRVMGIFRKLWGDQGLHPSWGPQLEDLLRHVTQTFVQVQGYTLVDIPAFLEDDGFRATVLARATPEIRQYWERSYDPRKDQASYRASTLNKVRKFTDHEILSTILGQSRSTVNVRAIMDQGKALFVKLPEGQLGAEGASLIGALMSGQILQAMLARSEQDQLERRPFSFYVDEFHLFATTDFARFFTEGRKFGVATTVAHQARYQLDSQSKHATLAVSNRVVFRVSGQDAAELQRGMTYTAPRPTMPLVREPLAALLAKPHMDPVIRTFIEEQARPLLEQDRRDNHEFRKEFVETIGLYYFHLMNSSWDETLREHADGPLSGHSIEADVDPSDLRAAFLSGIASWIAPNLGIQEPQVDQYHFIHKNSALQPIFKRFENASPTEMWELEQVVERASEAIDRQIDEQESRIRHQSERRQAYLEARDSILYRCMKSLDENDSDDTPWQELEQFQLDQYFESLRNTPSKTGSIIQQLRDFMTLMVTVGRILAKHPIRESSAYGAETAAGSSPDIVTLLANLPAFEARVRLQQDHQVVEHGLRLNPPEPSGPADRVHAHRGAITEHAHRTYTHARIDVERDTRARQTGTTQSPTSDTPNVRVLREHQAAPSDPGLSRVVWLEPSPSELDGSSRS